MEEEAEMGNNVWRCRKGDIDMASTWRRQWRGAACLGGGNVVQAMRRGGRWTKDWIGCWAKLNHNGGGKYFIWAIS